MSGCELAQEKRKNVTILWERWNSLWWLDNGEFRWWMELDGGGEETEEEEKRMTAVLALYRGGRATQWRHAGWTCQREAAAGDHGHA
jgi:hypothetical protein